MNEAASRVPCSIVLAVLALELDVEARLRVLCAEAAANGGEVVVGSGAGPMPPTLSDQPNLLWFAHATAGIFSLRREAISRARGDVVVLTEDHCEVEPGWLAQVLESHARHPDADVVVGRVVNGTTATAIDRAAFFVSLGPLMTPVDRLASAAAIPVAGAALKRRTIERLTSCTGEMPFELVPSATLEQLGLRVVVDDGLRMAHLQAGSWALHARLHFHNARAVSGSKWRRGQPRTWLRLVGSPALIALRTAATLRRVRAHGASAGVLASALPGLVWLYTAKAVGEWAGTLLGEGLSPQRLR